MFASKDLFLTPPSAGGYTIARSVRLRSSATAYFGRTPASAGNRQKFTISAWVKRGKLTTSSGIFGAGATSANEDRFMFTASDTLLFDSYIPGTNFSLNSTAVYRDPSAWYHVVGAVDTTQATASDRVKLYVNGTQITSFATATYPAQNANCNINNNVAQYIGTNPDNYYYDGYLTEINFIDGQQLTPSSFGSTNATTGVWQPAKYTGTYGTNGFYLNFSDNSSNTATTIGKDYSGNANNWTPNNISVTAGVTYDSMTDVPTLTSATAANYAVLNPLTNYGSLTLSNANLTVATTSAGPWKSVTGTIGASTGQFYWEVTIVSFVTNQTIGIASIAENMSLVFAGYTATSYGYYANGQKSNNNSATSYGASYTTGDIVGVALDLNAGTITFYKNGTSQGTAFTGLSSSLTYCAVCSVYGATDSQSINFGQRPFSYTPPTGFVALNTYNLPTSTITNGAAYMAANLYTGNGSNSRVVSGYNFSPDFVWIKARSNTSNHGLFDILRSSGTAWLGSNLTDSETTTPNYGGLNSLTSDGFTTKNGGIDNTITNQNGYTYVAWAWKANGAGVSNTNGSITSTVSVGATQGFSVVTYTGTGANATVGHGLGVAPNMIIIKKRSAVGAWVIGFTYSGFTWSTDYFQFDTSAKHTDGAGTVFTAAPTSTVFSLGTDAGENGSGATFVAYCFSAVAGYSAFGSYTGNGSADGPFVYTGFRPRYLLRKRSDSTSNWLVMDSVRGSYNVDTPALYPNISDAEDNGPALDLLSNGFKVRGTGSAENTSGGTYIYACFAENPFRNALAR